MKSAVSAALAYAGLSVALTWPLVLGLGRDVPGDLGDSLLNMWILAWGAGHVPQLLTGAISWNEFWNANIFHPAPLALALSEHLFGQTLQILPVYWLTGNIILCYNLLFITTFTLSGFGTYLLVRDLTGNTRAAFIAGLVFGFLPYRIASVPHLQVMSSQWMPFALWGLNRFVTLIPDPGSRIPAYRALALGTGALVLQNWSCGYYLLYFAPFVPLFVLHRMWTLGTVRSVRTWALLGSAAIGTLVLSLPFLFPYREAQLLFGIERPFGEVVAFSANAWSYVTASENLNLWGQALRFSPRPEGETFLGFMPWLLAFVAIAVLLFRDPAASPVPVVSGFSRIDQFRPALTWILGIAVVTQFVALASVMIVGGFDVSVLGLHIRARTPMRVLFQFVAAAGLLLAVSPRMRDRAVQLVRSPAVFFLCATMLAMWLSLGPMPSAGDGRVSGFGIYGVLYDYVPGFNGVRVPARYAMIAGLFLAVLAGYGVKALCSSWQFRSLPSALCLVLLSAAVLVEGAAIPMEINRTWNMNEATPPARVYPTSRPGGRSPDEGAPPVYARIAALPDGSVITEFPFGDMAWEIRYVYYSAAHGKPITNGYSGAFPPRYKERLARLQRVTANPEAAWQTLRDSGTTHVVFHRNAFAKAEDADAVAAWFKSRGATELERFPDGDILLSVN